MQLDYIWSMAILRIRAGSIVDDKRVLTWEGKWIIGCDALAQEYHAVGVDSNGVSFIFRGQIDRDQLIMESMGESPMRLRFTFDARDSNAIKWKNERSIGGDSWRLIEEYVLIPDRERREG